MSQLGSKQSIKSFNRKRKQIRKKGKRIIKQTIALRNVKKRALKKRQERTIITSKVISPRHKADLIRPTQPFALKRSSLESTAIKSFDYDPLTLSLVIQFWIVKVQNKVIISKRPGGKYIFFQVPDSVHNNFIKASSKGRFFNANIKNKYSFSKIG
ncbi:hypothetical protein LCGC14_0566920 [marine sediment metagenome]|uniref:KTSC domain-containing protein n=1 Tax=marine sediment metagenome TaxID=412755 RepID=A0A0F9RK87_9ZZZZ